MKVAVIGSGIQGCGVALELATRGAQVALLERGRRLCDGASRNSEGKLHLGFVYAGDGSLQTARMMARGAATFAPIVRDWLGGRGDALLASAPFHYAVHRDSLHPPELLGERYAAIGAVVREEVPDGAYLGVVDAGAVRRLETGELHPFGPDVIAAFTTEELAVEPDRLADALVAAVLAHDAITTQTATRVVTIDRHTRTLRIQDAEGEREAGPFDQIVNAAWDGRLALDASAGIAPPPRWSFRAKYACRVALRPQAAALPSTTVALGPFGDVVGYGDGTAYLSWYPVGRIAWSEELLPPVWPPRIGGEHGAELAAAMADGLRPIVPAAHSAITDASEVAVRGGAIYARGNTDVDDPGSELHERYRVGPVSYDGGYHSVDSAKYTVAPLFARELADRITGTRRPIPAAAALGA